VTPNFWTVVYMTHRMQVTQLWRTENIPNTNNKTMWLSEFTFKAVNSKLPRWFWEAGLISVTVHGPDAEQASPTLQSGYCDRVSYAAVGEPAVVTLVQTASPGSVELARGCQRRIPRLTFCTRLLKGHLSGHRSIVHFTWKKKMVRWMVKKKLCQRRHGD